MARGGYREPKGGVRAKGVGKNSQRTDANQPIDVPNVGDSSDLTQGDRQKLEAGMRVQPIGRAPSPSMAAAPPRGGPLPTAGGGAELPPHVFQLPSTRPGEPETEGLGMGPGNGPEVLANQPDPDDDREYVLHFLSGPPFNNEAAAKMLQDIRAERQQVTAPPMAAVPAMDEPEMAPAEEELIPDLGNTPLPEEDLATEGAAAGEEVDQTSVETPAAPSGEELV